MFLAPFARRLSSDLAAALAYALRYQGCKRDDIQATIKRGVLPAAGQFAVASAREDESEMGFLSPLSVGQFQVS